MACDSEKTMNSDPSTAEDEAPKTCTRNGETTLLHRLTQRPYAVMRLYVCFQSNAASNSLGTTRNLCFSRCAFVDLTMSEEERSDDRPAVAIFSGILEFHSVSFVRCSSCQAWYTQTHTCVLVWRCFCLSGCSLINDMMVSEAKINSSDEPFPRCLGIWI